MQLTMPTCMRPSPAGTTGRSTAQQGEVTPRRVVHHAAQRQRSSWTHATSLPACRRSDRVATRAAGRDEQPAPAVIMGQGSPVITPRTQDMAGDPFGLLLRQRVVFLGGEVNDFGADALVSQLLLLDSQAPNKDIKLFINSPGGSVTAGMGIYDAMQMCRCDVQTYCFGLAASMGAFLLGAGTKGKRYSMPNARIMIHQPLGGASGQAVDIEIQAKEIMYHKANLNGIMAEYTGQPIEKIEEDTDRDRYMSPLEAKRYGIIDHVIGGDDAGFQVTGSAKDFPKTKEQYVNWGDFDDDGSQSRRFKGVPLEPHTEPISVK